MNTENTNTKLNITSDLLEKTLNLSKNEIANIIIPKNVVDNKEEKKEEKKVEKLLIANIDDDYVLNASKENLLKYISKLSTYGYQYLIQKLDNRTENLVKLSLLTAKNSIIIQKKEITKHNVVKRGFKLEDIYERLEREEKTGKVADHDILNKSSKVVVFKLPSKAFSISLSCERTNKFFTDCLGINLDEIEKSKSSHSLYLQLRNIYGKIMKDPKIASQHNISIGTYLYKGEGSINDIKSFRPIIMIPNLVKFLHKNIYLSIARYLSNNKFIDTEICKGGVRGVKNGIFEQALKAKFCLKKSQKEKTPCCLIFIDLTNAFGNVDVKLLCKILKIYGISENIISYVENYYTDFKYFFKCGKMKTEILTLKKGIIQGCPLSMLLFIMYINYILIYIDKLYKNKYGYEYSDGNKILSCAFVDDICFICKDVESGAKLYSEAKAIFESFGFEFNTKKSVYVSINDNEEKTIEDLGRVKEFKYLGFNIYTEEVDDAAIIVKELKSKLNLVMKMNIPKDNKLYLIVKSVVPSIIRKLKFIFGTNSAYENVERIINIYIKKLTNDYSKKIIDENTKSCLQINSPIVNELIKEIGINYEKINNNTQLFSRYNDDGYSSMKDQLSSHAVWKQN